MVGDAAGSERGAGPLPSGRHDGPGRAAGYTQAYHAPCMVPSASMKELRITPLRCSGCGAGAPLGTASFARCAYCGTETRLPEAYVSLQHTVRSFAMNRDLAASLYGELGRPPSWLTMFVGRIGGSVAGYCMIALMGVLAIIPRYPHIGIPMLAAFLFLVSYPVGLLLHGIGYVAGVDEWVGPLSPYFVCPIAVGFLVVFVAIPAIRADKESRLEDVRIAVHASLAAVPPAHPGGPASCRNCGAALDVANGALGAPCVYCGADNLVALPDDWVRVVRGKEHQHFNGIDEALRAWRAASGSAHEAYWKLFVLAVVSFVLAWPSAWLMDQARVSF